MLIRNVAGSVVLFLAMSAEAGVTWYTGTVVRALTDERSANDSRYPNAKAFSGCAAYVDPAPSTQIAGCTGGYVALGCDGVVISKQAAEKNWQNAQLSLVTGGQIKFWLDDSLRTGGNCIAQSSISYPAP